MNIGLPGDLVLGDAERHAGALDFLGDGGYCFANHCSVGDYFTKRKLVKRKVSVTETPAGADVSGVKESAFATAARKFNVPEEELMLFMMRKRRPGPGSWSQWEHGRKGLPADALVDFLQERREREQRQAREAEQVRTREQETTLNQIYSILERLSLAFDQSRQGRLRPRPALTVGPAPPPGPASASR